MKDLDYKMKWKKGSRVTGDVDAVYDFLEEVRAEKGGKLDLDLAVERSRPEDAPTHDMLEWDDPTAAHQWRRTQMRHIVAAIVYERPGREDARVYEAVVTTEESDEPEEGLKRTWSFMTTDDIVKDPGLREEMVLKALADFKALLKRYEILHELALVRTSVARVESRIWAEKSLRAEKAKDHRENPEEVT